MAGPGVARTFDGACHCRAVHFTVRSRHAMPYQLCYCSICRQTQGGGGYAINISADAASLKLYGGEHARIYHAHLRSAHHKDNAHHKDKMSSAERRLRQRIVAFQSRMAGVAAPVCVSH